LIKLSGDVATPIAYTVFDQEGWVLQQGSLGPNDGSVQIVAPQAGELFSVLTDTGLNAAQVSLAGLTCVIEASSLFPFETFRSAGTYQLNPHSDRLKFRAHTPGPESAAITVQSPDGSISQTTIVNSFTEFYVEAGAPTPQAGWQILVEPAPSQPFGDLRLYLYDAEAPYLSVK